VQLLHYDEGALTEGRLVVERLKCTMPDGMLIDYDSREQDPLTFSFKDALNPNQSGRIYLSVPVRLDGAASDKAAIRRFRSRQENPRVDDNTGEGGVVLQRLQPIMSLSIGEEPGKQYVSLPLMEVWRPENATIELTSYCPPTTNLQACEFLQEHSPLQRARTLAVEIRKRARRLAGIVGDGNESLGTSVSERQRQWIVALVKSLPELEVLVDSVVVHPFELYRVLAGAMGQLSELSRELLPPKLPAYLHMNMAEGFDKALEFLRNTIEEISLSYTTFAFAEEQYGVFSLQFDKAWKGRKVYFELRPPPNATAEQAEAWMNAGCVASSSQQRVLHEQRMSGAEVIRVPSDKEGEIQARAGNLLFRMEDSPYVLPGQKLVIRLMDKNLDSMRPKRIFLHVPLALPTEG
jgi:type VI secretion system protein ImpJ